MYNLLYLFIKYCMPSIYHRIRHDETLRYEALGVYIMYQWGLSTQPLIEGQPVPDNGMVEKAFIVKPMGKYNA